MKFKLSKASDPSNMKPLAIDIKTMDDMEALQRRLITEEMEKRGFKKRSDLLNETAFNYELIIDFHTHTITFWNYWME